MFKTLKQFFDFCNKEDRNKLYLAIALGVIKAIFAALRMPAIAVVVQGLIEGQLTMKHLWLSLSIMVVSVLGQFLINLKTTMLQCEAGYHSCAHKRIEIAEHLRYLPMGFFNKNSLGAITNVTTNTMESLADIATRIVMITTQGILTTAVITCFVFAFDWRIGLVLAVGIVLYIIEDNLTEPIKTENIADKLHCSKSTIEKLFRYINNISIRDYIIRRRMSNVSREIVSNPEKSLLDIAVEYGYGSNEAFSRAFCSVWQVSPSEFRKNPSKFELFPGYRIDRELMKEKTMDDRKKIDISELYDCIRERKGCYLVLGDIKSLIPINEISHKAGDLAIITAMKRMEQAAGAEDIVFRIGGDEFVILTNSKEENYSNSICEEIISHNDEPIFWEEKEIPLSLYVKVICYEGRTALRYSEFFTMLQNELSEEYKRQYF